VRAALAPGVDVVHVHGLARMAWWLRGARARRGAPLVLTAHASDELGPSASAAGDAPPARARRHARRVRAMLRRADAVLAPSRFMADAVEAAGAPHVHVVPLGPTDETPAAPVPHAGFVVLALARFVPVKGLRVLVDAFAAAFADVPDARLVLAGDSPDRAALEADDVGAGPRVTIACQATSKARRAARPRRRRRRRGADAQGLQRRSAAAVDSAAAGAAVVVMTARRCRSASRGGAGLVVPAGDVGAWARALRGLWADRARRRLGRRPVEPPSRAIRGRVAAAHGRCTVGSGADPSVGRPRAGPS
jgi:glycosyltransferase involved in cell wall biosynthesis